jgi:hypothetical protein
MAKDEPVGVVYSMQDGYIGQMLVKDIPHKTKLYTHPHQWQGLTDDEVIMECALNFGIKLHEVKQSDIDLCIAIEQALKEKNTVS